MTVADLIERLLRFPDFASDMVVTIRDEERDVDHDVYSAGSVYLNFEFADAANEAAWIEGRLETNGTVLNRLLQVDDADDLDEHIHDDDGA